MGGNGGSGGFGNGASGGAGGAGGGIYNAGWSSLTSATITLNVTGAGGNAGNGSSFEVGSGSTYNAGGAGGAGGGIDNPGWYIVPSGGITLNASGISGAVYSSDVLNLNASTNVMVRNTLIAWNAASPAGLGGTNIARGGIFPLPPILEPSTVREHGLAPDLIGSDLAGAFTSQGFNLVSMADDSTGFINGEHADQVGSRESPLDPLLGPLQMNGGFTPTHALLSGSPALDQGNSSGGHTDQRGDRRPYVFPNLPHPLGGDGGDIGAFELQ